ncbi:hypothetical protein [Halosimplex sp. TS25]|uniref:hypothetical protein n=1 Tax=Halosimplex rarum TaxID=3396619 RepID=UPI0039E83D5A
MARLENVPVEALETALDGSSGATEAERLVMAVIYKRGPSVPMIAEWLDVREQSIYRWFGRLGAVVGVEYTRRHVRRLLKDAGLSRAERSRTEAVGADGRAEFWSATDEWPDRCRYVGTPPVSPRDPGEPRGPGEPRKPGETVRFWQCPTQRDPV